MSPEEREKFRRAMVRAMGLVVGRRRLRGPERRKWVPHVSPILRDMGIRESREQSIPRSAWGHFPFRYSVRCHRNCGNVRLSQTDITRLFYSAAVPENLHRTYGARDLHFLTFSCYQRRPLLNHASRCDLFLQILERVRRRYRLVVLGYVVMPEHVHPLVTERREPRSRL